jgi:ribonuclease HI
MDEIVIFTDGGSRGNPGPGACAFAAMVDKTVIKTASKYLGRTTNNIAEYEGVLLALKWISEETSGVKEIDFFLDSQLVYKQLIGEFKIKSDNIKLLVIAVKRMEKNIRAKIYYHHVPRSKNKLADKLVNIELDKN